MMIASTNASITTRIGNQIEAGCSPRFGPASLTERLTFLDAGQMAPHPLAGIRISGERHYEPKILVVRGLIPRQKAIPALDDSLINACGNAICSGAYAALLGCIRLS